VVLMELIRDLLIFIAAMFAMCIVLIVVVSNLPDQNPLKRILTALSYRVGATLLAGAVAVPVEPIPGLDVLYDLAVPIALIWYWLTFFRDAVRSPTTASPPFFGALYSRPSLEAKRPGR
jgi:Na+/glutamate symporter